MYGLLATAAGYTHDYIDDCMTWPRFNELTSYWSRHPPIHILVSLMFGNNEDVSGHQFFVEAEGDKASREVAANPEAFMAYCARFGIPIVNLKKAPKEMGN